MRITLGLLINTHWYLIEPLANGTHVVKVFAKRFLQFFYQLRKCQKVAVRDTIYVRKLSIISASANGGPRSRVCARYTLRSAPH